MNKITVEPRNLKMKTNELRATGVIPGVVYGPTIDNQAVKISENELKKVLSKKGEVYKLMTNGKDIMVKVGEIQTHPVSAHPIHFSLVELNKGVNTLEIPVDVQGEAEGTKSGGVITQLKEFLNVSAMLKDMPDKIEINVSKLLIGDNFTVGDIKTNKKIKIEEGKDEVIVVCSAPTVLKSEKVDEEDDLMPPMSKETKMEE